MFIYKITIITSGKMYFGLDTKPSYKNSRWKIHCDLAFNKIPKYKLHKEMKLHGIENCQYEIVETGFTSIGKLALAEIRYIQQYNTYKNGLNSSPGGDGLGRNNLTDLTDLEIQEIRNSLGEHWKEWNKRKWANTTPEQRKEMMKHAFLPEVIARRSETLKNYYKCCPEAIEKKREQMKISRNYNKEYRDQKAREAGLKGALAMSKSVLVEFPDGTTKLFISKSEMQRQTSQWAKTIISKTKQGLSHNGYKAWEINNE